MQEQLLQWFEISGIFAIFLSILANVIVNVLGVIPAAFIAAANVLFFGFWWGLLISLVGEVIGAVVAFCLYRKGITTWTSKFPVGNKYIKRLQETEGREAFWLVVILRLILIIPAGVVSFVSAGSRIRLSSFVIASTLGKIPPLIIKVYAMYQVFTWTWQGQMILFGSGIFVIGIFVWKRFLKK